MSWYQKRVFFQSSFDEPLAAGKVGRGIGPFDHPRWLFNFNYIVKEVTQAIESLFLRMHTHNLVSWRLTGCSENAHFGGQVKVTFNQFEQVVLLHDAEGA